MTDFTGLIAEYPYAGLFTLLLLGTAGLPIPEDTILILCGVLISRGTVSPVPALLTIYSGMLLTDFALYGTARKVGSAVVTAKFFRRRITPGRLELLEKKMTKWWLPALILGRQAIGLRSQVFIAAGVIRVPALKFLAADALAAPITISLMVGAGYLGGRSLRFVREDWAAIMHSLSLAVVALAALAVAALIIRTRLQRSR